MPSINAKVVKAEKRKVPCTSMGWEVFPQGIFNILKKFDQYNNINKIILTENGASFEDQLEDGHIHDIDRRSYFQQYIAQVFKAKTARHKYSWIFYMEFYRQF